MVEKRLVAVGFCDGQRAGDAFDLFQRPPSPSDAQILVQTHGIPEPNVGVFSGFPQVERDLMVFTQRQSEFHRGLVIRAPILVG